MQRVNVEGEGKRQQLHAHDIRTLNNNYCNKKTNEDENVKNKNTTISNENKSFSLDIVVNDNYSSNNYDRDT